jgi:hypothetical protein
MHDILPSPIIHSKEMALCPVKNARHIGLWRGYLAKKEAAITLACMQLTNLTTILN